MADTAERVVVEIEARTQGYVSAINGAASATDAGMTRIERAANDAETAIVRSSASVAAAHGRQATAIEDGARRSSQANVILQSAVRKTTDQFAAGAPLSIIFAEHLETFALAAEQAGGKLAPLGAFLGGPWGIALTAASAIASTFAGKLLEGGASVEKETEKLEKNAEKAEFARQAKEAFAHTEAGAVASIQAVTDKLKEQNDELRTNAERNNIAAKVALANAQANRDRIAEDVRKGEAYARLTPAQQAAASLQDGSGAQAATQLPANRAALAEIDARIAQGKAALERTRADLADESAVRANDPVAQIKRLYEGPDGLIEQAKKRAIAEGTVGTALTRQLTVLRAQRQTKIDAAQKDKRNDGAFNQIGRTINEDQARAIVEGVGGRVTSTYRSTAKQAELYAAYKNGTGSLAAKPGTSLHEAGQAIDVAKEAGVTLKKLVEAFRAQGVQVSEALDEGNHYHIGFGRKAGGKSQTTLDNEANTQNQKSIADNKRFADERAALQGELIASQRTETRDAATLAALATKALDAATKKRTDDINAEERAVLEDKNASAARKAEATAHAAVLRGLNQQVDAVKRGAIEEEKNRALAADRFDAQSSDLRNQQDILQAASGLAERSDQRKAIELQLLDLKYQELRAQEQYNLQQALDRKDATGAANARARLSTLDTLERSDAARVDQQSRGSYATRRKELAGDFTTVQESVDAIKVDALDKLEDSLVGSAKAALGLHGALGDVLTSIIRIGIERRLIGPLADGLFGKADGSSSGAFGGFLSSIIGGLSGKTGNEGGAGIDFAPGSAAVDSQLASLAGLFHFAQGGSFEIGGQPGVDRNVLSINGSPVAMVGQGERLAISPNTGAAQRSGNATIVNAPQFNLKGAVVTTELYAEMQRISNQSAATAGRVAYGQALRGAPSAVQRAQTLGTTG